MAITGWMASGRTSRLMSVAAEAWRRGLVDVSAGNKRLYYSPLRVGTLRLADAESSAFARLLRGDEVKLNELVPDDGTPDGLATAARAHKAADLLAAKGKVGEEETGDNPVRLAIGLATWTQEEPVVSGQSGPRRERAPQAPLLLAPVTFSLIPGTRSVSSLQLTGEPELNTALRFVLRAHHNVDLDAEGWLAEAVSPGGALDPDRLMKAATRLAGRVSGWAVQPNTVVDAFGSDRELMLRDLEDEGALSEHPLLAAMAGDPDAQALVRGSALPTDGSDLAAPDSTPPAVEHLVLDADSSQQAVISHALAGRNLVVQGPPGSGKSQTIANLLAEAMAAGKTVLFVAQKRAAVDAVLTRLEGVGLSGNVLEVFDSKTKRGNVIAQLRESLDNLSGVPIPDTKALHSDLTAARDRLVAHNRSLHDIRDELGGDTVYNLLGRIAAIPGLHQTGQRLPFDVVRHWQGVVTDRLASDLAELTTLNGLDPQREQRPGWNVATAITQQAVAAGYDAAASVAGNLRAGYHLASGTLASVGLPVPETLKQAQNGLQLLAHVASAITVLGPQCLDPSVLEDAALPRMHAAFGSKAERKALPTKVGMLERRRLRKQLLPLVRPDALGASGGTPDDRTVQGWLAGVMHIRSRWAEAPLGVADPSPGPVPGRRTRSLPPNSRCPS